MRIITCIEDLRQRARRRVPKMFFDYAEAGSYARGDAARQPRRPRAHQAAPARAGRRVATRPEHHHHRRAGAAAARRSRRSGCAACSTATARSPPAAPRRRPAFRSRLSHHVGLLDRGRGRRGRQAVLVPALRDEGSRLRAIADRAGGGGEMQRAGADHRPAGARPAPLRRAERPDGAAGNPPEERHRHRDQAGLGARHRCAASARPSATSPAMRRAAPT